MKVMYTVNILRKK